LITNLASASVVPGSQTQTGGAFAVRKQLMVIHEKSVGFTHSW
jgi:hypothetical protein